jgi:hypothetical protein
MPHVVRLFQRRPIATVSIPQPIKAAMLAPRPMMLFFETRYTKNSRVDARKSIVVMLNKSELVILYPPK